MAHLRFGISYDDGRSAETCQTTWYVCLTQTKKVFLTAFNIVSTEPFLRKYPDHLNKYVDNLVIKVVGTGPGYQTESTQHEFGSIGEAEAATIRHWLSSVRLSQADRSGLATVE